MSISRTLWIGVVCTLLAIRPALGLTPEEAARQLAAMDWYTEEYPPYNFMGEDGVPTGMAVDILMAAFARIGVNLSPADLEIAPWNRSYKYIQTRPNTALFSMNQTPEREQIMRFVGPSIPSEVALIAPRALQLRVEQPGELGAFNIGVVRDDIGDQLLLPFNLDEAKVTRKNSLKQLLFLLKVGKIDMVAYASDVFLDSVKRSGGSPSEFEVVFSLRKGYMGYAFHQSTDPAVLAPLQSALDELRAEGEVDRIINSYR